MKLFVILVILKLYVQTQSQETDSLETRVVLIEIFMWRWNLPSGPKHR